MFAFDNIVTSHFLNIYLSVCIVSCGKETQEVVYFGLSACSACLACAPFVLSFVCVGVIRNRSKAWFDLHRLTHFAMIVLTIHHQEV